MSTPKNFLKISNWSKWQSYRADRGQPPWIKLHRSLMRNPEWISLTDLERGQLASLWLLAADKNGMIPDDISVLSKICFLSDPLNINKFIELGFIDANVTPRRRQRDANVTPQSRVEDIDEIREEEKIYKKENQESNLPQKTKPPPKSKTRKTTLPDNWTPNETSLKIAIDEGYSDDERKFIFEQFTSSAIANGRKYASWDAAFNTWIRNSYTKNDIQSKRNGTGKRFGSSALLNAVDNVLRAS